MAGEPLAAHGPLVEAQRLDLRPHRAVEHQNPLREQRFQEIGFVVRHGGQNSRSQQGQRKAAIELAGDDVAETVGASRKDSSTPPAGSAQS